MNNKQNIVVTGAGGTLCSEIAVQLAKEGAKVVISARRLPQLEEVAEEIRAKLAAGKYRVSVDDSQNTLKYKIRNAQLEKVPYMIILGDKDIENKTVSVRHRSGEDLGAITMDEFQGILADVVDNKLKK